MDTASVIQACQSGDREALALLYKTYSLPMKEVIGWYVHDGDVVQDILHDGFIIAFTTIGALRDHSKVEPWLITIMRNLSLQYLRRRAAEIHVSLSEDPTLSETLSDCPYPDGTETAFTLKQLEAFIGSLPRGYGNVFRLSVLQGMSHKEIAAMLGISPQTSASQLFRAKAMLRRIISDHRARIGSVLLVFAASFALWRMSDGSRCSLSEPLLSSSAACLKDVVSESHDDGDGLCGPRRGLSRRVMGVVDPVDAGMIACILSPGSGSTHSSPPPDTLALVPLAAPAQSDTLGNPGGLPMTPPLVAECDFGEDEERAGGAWSLSLSYTGNDGSSENVRCLVPDISSSDGEMEERVSYRYRMPLTVGFSANKNLFGSWSVESGLRYTYLRTDFIAENEHFRRESVQRIHYLGIPLKVSCRLFDVGDFSLYGQAGVAVDIPVYGSETASTHFSDRPGPVITRGRLKASVQWSVEGGMGVEYRFSQSFSVYAEPSVRYYFDMESDVRTIRQERPLEVTVPIGVRLSW